MAYILVFLFGVFRFCMVLCSVCDINSGSTPVMKVCSAQSTFSSRLILDFTEANSLPPEVDVCLCEITLNGGSQFQIMKLWESVNISCGTHVGVMSPYSMIYHFIHCGSSNTFVLRPIFAGLKVAVRLFRSRIPYDSDFCFGAEITDGGDTFVVPLSFNTTCYIPPEMTTLPSPATAPNEETSPDITTRTDDEFTVLPPERACKGQNPAAVAHACTEDSVFGTDLLYVDYTDAMTLPVSHCSCIATIINGRQLVITAVQTPYRDSCGSTFETLLNNTKPSIVNMHRYLDCVGRPNSYAPNIPRDQIDYVVKPGSKHLMSVLKYSPPYNTSFCIRVQLSGENTNMTIRCHDMLQSNDGNSSDRKGNESALLEEVTEMKDNSCDILPVTVTLGVSTFIAIAMCIVAMTMLINSPKPKVEESDVVFGNAIIRVPKEKDEENVKNERVAGGNPVDSVYEEASNSIYNEI